MAPNTTVPRGELRGASLAPGAFQDDMDAYFVEIGCRETGAESRQKRRRLSLMWRPLISAEKELSGIVTLDYRVLHPLHAC